MPRTLAQNAQYIAETIKPAIKSAIEAQGVTVPSTDSFLDYADRIGEIEGGGSGYQLKDLPTGSISTVSDAAELPLNALKVSVEAWQEGSGDPSPSNIRPIHGWDSGEITVNGFNQWDEEWEEGTLNPQGQTQDNQIDLRSKNFNPIKGGVDYYYALNTAMTGLTRYVFWYDADKNFISYVLYNTNIKTAPLNACYFKLVATSYIRSIGSYQNNICFNISDVNLNGRYEPYQGTTKTVDFNQEVYGGSANLLIGEGKSTYQKIKVSDLTWEYNSQYTVFIAYPVNDKKLGVSNLLSESYKTSTAEALVNMQDNEIRGNGVYKYIYIKDYRYDNVTDFVNYCGNVEIVFEKGTPTTFAFDPIPTTNTLEGVNNLYADCGEVLEGEYFVDEGAIDVRKVDYSIGSNSALKISDGRILQGFASMSGYHARPLDASGNWLDVDWNEDWEIGSAFKVLSFPSGGNATIFGCGVSGSMNFAPNVYFWNGSTAYITLSENGSSSAVDTALNYIFQIDTWYFVRAKFTKSTLNLKIEISTDMTNFTTVYNDTLAAAPYHDAASISIGGMAQSANYASNSILIDTFNTYIKGDGISWGASTGVFPS